jgi:DNA end-binding protein Ku
MAPRAIWTGAITFGLVSVPVGLHSAVERSKELRFRLLHEKDSSPIDYRRVCEKEDKEVPWDEIVKGYEYEKGRYVVVTDRDFARAKVAATQMFEIRDFVPARAIDFMYFEHPYYLAPTGKAGAKAYALLRDALERSGRVGVGTIVLRQRERLAALQAVDGVLLLTTMRFAHEIRPPGSLDLPAAGRGYTKGEMDLALRLIDTLAGDWKPEKYKDTYYDELMKIIEQKAEGREITVPKARQAPKVVDLMDALRKSLAGARPAPMRGAGPRAARRRAQPHRKAA